MWDASYARTSNFQETSWGCCFQGYCSHQFGTCWSVFPTLPSNFSFTKSIRGDPICGLSSWISPVRPLSAPEGSLCLPPARRPALPVCCGGWRGTLAFWGDRSSSRPQQCHTSARPLQTCAATPLVKAICGWPAVWWEMWRIISVGFPDKLSSTSAIPQHQTAVSCLHLLYRCRRLFWNHPKVTFDRRRQNRWTFTYLHVCETEMLIL